jgi:hypothetical protein
VPATSPSPSCCFAATEAQPALLLSGTTSASACPGKMYFINGNCAEMNMHVCCDSETSDEVDMETSPLAQRRLQPKKTKPMMLVYLPLQATGDSSASVMSTTALGVAVMISPIQGVI